MEASETEAGSASELSSPEARCIALRMFGAVPRVLIGCTVFALVGCGSLGQLAQAPFSNEGNESRLNTSSGGIPPQLRGGGAQDEEGEAKPIAVEQGIDPAEVAAARFGVSNLPREEDMVFTNPDDLESSEDLLKTITKGQKEIWLRSHTIARRQALAKGKTLLIWFADSPSSTRVGSPSSLRLQQELFAKNEFGEWAEEHLVRLKLDFNVEDQKLSNSQSADVMSRKANALRKMKYLESLKSRYKVRGFPSLVMVASDGTVINQVRGYRSGNADYVWGLIKTAVVVSDEKRADLEKKLEQKGYRHWSGKNEVEIFARLGRVREDEILLLGPDGARYQTSLENLSAADQLWIEEQREKRNSR